MTKSERRDFWEMLKMLQTRSMILTSQLRCPAARADRRSTLADGILDRLVHNAHRIEMRGESMRKKPERKGK